MSAAQDAWKAAGAAIEQAKRTGAESLEFTGEAFRALAALPPGIGALDKLRTLILDRTQVSDLAPLQGLTGLQYLRLYRTPVSDLAPLQGLTGLQTLLLDATPVSDLAPLQGLAGLQNLSLNVTQVSDLAPLKGLTGLQTLLLDATPVSDLGPLQGLMGLQILTLDTTPVGDLAPLRGLTGLQRLSLDTTPVSDLAPLRGLTGLQILSLNTTQVSDLTPLQGLTGLQSLSLIKTPVNDLAPLRGLTGLQALRLNNTQVSDLAPLRGLTGLQILSLDTTQVSDLTPLRGRTGLRDLWLDSTQVSDLAPLRGLTGLHSLSLNNTQVSDLAPLRGLTGLQSLFLNNTQVSDLAPLLGLTGLQSLLLNTTQVSDLAPLQGLTGLQELWLDNTQVSDLAPLLGLTGLQDLWLDNTQVSDLAPLRGLTGLQSLRLERTRVLDLRPLAGLRRLADEPRYGGLWFRGIPATADPQIAVIAGSGGHSARAKALFDLLDGGWVPPVATTPLDDPPPETGSTPAFFFLSYASQDRSRIGTLRDFLTGQGLPLWWDQDIPAGAEWRRTIATQLDAAKAVVTFWTQESVARKAVAEEASHAQATGRLLHVRLDDAPLPWGFGETQYVDLRGWDGTATHPQMAKLLQALHDRLNPPDAAAMAARLLAASPVAMLPKGGKLAPVDTPPNARPEVVNAPDLAARVEGLKQILAPLRAKAADRDNYQFPADLGHALAAVHSALHAETLSWYGIDDARAELCDCMSAHDAGQAWNATMVGSLERLIQRLEELRPLLQPRQVPAGEAGAKPPEPDPVVRAADVAAVQDLAGEVSQVLNSAEAGATLDPASIDLMAKEVARIGEAAEAVDETRRYGGLRKAVRGLAYATGGIIGAATSGVVVSLLTVPEAAATLAARLRPIFDRLLQFFL
ncbi:MAG: leucine-rich repeat domain-containing protein [Rhodobacter sp.]|nr:leucine-rich repeat domain-containing protein [Rhodobacter sp.]